MMHTGETS